MLLKIYGKKKCPYCEKAKKLATQLEGFRNDFSFEYTDYEDAGMTKEDISEIVKNPVATLPQIVLDDKYIGGYTELERHVKKARLFSK